MKALSRISAADWRVPLLAAVFAIFAVIFFLVAPDLYRNGQRADPMPIRVLTAAIALCAVPIFVASCFSSRVSVFEDGVVLEWLWWPRFVPYADIVAIEEYGQVVRGLKLSLRDGTHVLIGKHEYDERHRVWDAIKTASEAARASESAPVELGRAGRTTREWIANLRAVADGTAATPRSAGIDLERLRRLIASPGARASDRAAAAVALAADPEAKAHIRVVADDVHDTRLRVALTAAADEDPTALEEALEKLEE